MIDALAIQRGATWAIAAIAAGGVVLRPGRVPEAVWAVLGAVLLVAFSLVPWRSAVQAVGSGTDVYLFLIGMMALAELARLEGVFDWLAARVVRAAHGSTQKLFAWVFAAGTLVTVLLSNDATAVVLTPAVFAACRAGKADPLPFLFICAFIANAASFVLPISNPANLVVFGSHMPALGSWLLRFSMPSLVSILATFFALRLTQRVALSNQRIATEVFAPSLSMTGRWTATGIALSVLVMLSASALGLRLGLPTFIVGLVTTVAVLLATRQPPWPLLKGISWSVLPLVAGLFVLVEGLDRTGVIRYLSTVVTNAAATAPQTTSWGSGLVVSVLCNLMNNLPVSLVAHSVITSGAAVPGSVSNVLLIAVDLGPNFSVTGSLATILWLIALRREGLEVSAWRFLRLGIAVTIPALLLTLAVSILTFRGG
jgi:arsenical pump membrane protein